MAKSPSKSKKQLEREIQATMAAGDDDGDSGPEQDAQRAAVRRRRTTQRLNDEDVRAIDAIASTTRDPMRRAMARSVQHQLMLADEADAFEAGEGAGYRRKAWALALPLFAKARAS